MQSADVVTVIRVAGRLLSSAGMSLWLAAMFLITWVRPNTFGELTVHHLLFVMLLEFLIVHCSGFMGAIAARDETRRQRLFMFSILIAFYALFAAGFSAMYGGWWPLLAFLGLGMSKFSTVVLRPPDMRGQNVLIVNWAAMTCLYLGGVFLTAVVSVPALGVTKDVITAQNFDTGGLWLEEPHRVLAFGVFYFTGLAILACINEIVAMVMSRNRKKDALGKAKILQR